MAFNDVIIKRLSSNSGRPAPGFDYYAGLIFYGTAPTVSGKWASYAGNPTIKAQQIFSASDAKSAGILANTDNVASAMTYLITTKGNTGDTLPISVIVPQQNGTTVAVSLGLYLVPSISTTIALQGADIAVMINSGTANHGFSASFATATLTITAPKAYGIALNTGTPYSFVWTGAGVGTTTQNTVAGTASQYAIWYYHIAEYFRMYPAGTLWLCVLSASSNFNEIATLQIASGYRLRQIGIYDTDVTRPLAANIIGTLTQIQSACAIIEAKWPLIVTYSPNTKGIDITTYPDQNINTASNVNCIVSQDGLGQGSLLYVYHGQSVGNIGVKLGTWSASRVSASDAQPIPAFNLSDGVENNTPAFSNGVLSSAMPDNAQVQLDNFRYTFFRKFDDTVTGTYWTDNKMCINSSSSYAFANDNRVEQKVSRLCRGALIPLINSELLFNADGTLPASTIVTFQGASDDAVTASMITGQGGLPEISAIKTTIDPTQKVQSTNTLILNVTIVENGIARNIIVNIAYGTI
jgi:hypothetical protein